MNPSIVPGDIERLLRSEQDRYAKAMSQNDVQADQCSKVLDSIESKPILCLSESESNSKAKKISKRRSIGGAA